MGLFSRNTHTLKEFSKFLSLFGIDFEKYKNHEIVNKKGKKYKFSQLDKKRIAELDWAYVLVKHNELLCFDYRESLDSLLAKVTAFQNGRIKKFCDWYKSDAERLRNGKNIRYFIKDIDLRTQCDYNQLVVHIENNDADTYILAVASVGRDTEFMKPNVESDGTLYRKFRNMGLALGINAILAQNFPEIAIKSTAFCKNINDAFINVLTYQKNMMCEERNEEAIKIAEQKEIEKQKNIMSKKFPEKEESAAKQMAIKVFEEGDQSLCKNKPKLKEKLIEAYKLVLLNKFGDEDDLGCEPVESALWSWFNEDDADPTVKEIVFYIRDRIEDYK